MFPSRSTDGLATPLITCATDFSGRKKLGLREMVRACGLIAVQPSTLAVLISGPAALIFLYMIHERLLMWLALVTVLIAALAFIRIARADLEFLTRLWYPLLWKAGKVLPAAHAYVFEVFNQVERCLLILEEVDHHMRKFLRIDDNLLHAVDLLETLYEEAEDPDPVVVCKIISCLAPIADEIDQITRVGPSISRKVDLLERDLAGIEEKARLMRMAIDEVTI